MKDIRTYRNEERQELIVDGVAFNIEQQMVVQKVLDHKDWQIRELKNHTYDLNNKLLNIHLFLKDLRNSFHKGDETYEEIDKKLKELGG